MEPISLIEFIEISQLSAPDVLHMLDAGELPSVHGENGELLIDLSRVTPTLIATRVAEKVLPQEKLNRELLEEVVASELTLALESVLDDAWEMALRWREQKDS